MANLGCVSPLKSYRPKAYPETCRSWRFFGTANGRPSHQQMPEVHWQRSRMGVSRVGCGVRPHRTFRSVDRHCRKPDENEAESLIAATLEELLRGSRIG